MGISGLFERVSSTLLECFTREHSTANMQYSRSFVYLPVGLQVVTVSTTPLPLKWDKSLR